MHVYVWVGENERYWVSNPSEWVYLPVCAKKNGDDDDGYNDVLSAP